MSTEDRQVVKALLQYLTEKGLTGSEQFRAAIKHFNVSTAITWAARDVGFLNKELVYEMDVFTPENIDSNPHGERRKFKSLGEVEAVREEVKTSGDEPTEETVQEFDIYQRADGVQLAVNCNGIASFMRPFKNANWLQAGFETNLEYFWLVSQGVKIWGHPNQKAVFIDGVLSVESVA